MVCIILSTISYMFETVPRWSHLPIWTYIEWFVSIAFTIEYVVRILSSRNSWYFFWDIMNFVDILAIMPFWIDLTFGSKGSKN